MSIDDEREELRRQMEALNNVRALLERVQAHAKYLLSISEDNRNDMQNIWVLAYEAIELKMAKGSEDSLRESTLSLPLLDRLREVTTNEFAAVMENDQKNERRRFSFFGRRRN